VGLRSEKWQIKIEGLERENRLLCSRALRAERQVEALRFTKLNLTKLKLTKLKLSKLKLHKMKKSNFSLLLTKVPYSLV
jgi:hypothetical protein